jgi:hypothetical protein
MIRHHDNISVAADADCCQVIIQIDEDRQLSIDTYCVAEFIDKLSEHRRHPRVAEMFERIAKPDLSR